MSYAVRRAKTDVRAAIAQVLLSREVGQRIPTVQELQRLTHVGTGTVVKALRSLESSGSVSLSSHGHQGTVVVTRHAGRLWNDAHLGNFSLVMPPPGPVEQHGAQEAIVAALGRMGVPVVSRSMPGARRRLEELYQDRAHAVLVSGGAFRHAQVDLPGLTAIDLGESTFYAVGSLVVVERPDRDPSARLRVGIDRGSFDHALLTETEFAEADPEYIDSRFVSAPAAVLGGRVDAAVWHAMPTVISPQLAGLVVRPLREDTIRRTTDVARGVLVTRALDAGVNALARGVHPAEVAKIQQRLLRQAAESEADGEFSRP